MGKISELEKLEYLIDKYKTETDSKKKHIYYLDLVDETLILVKKTASGIYPLPSSVNREDLLQVGAVGALIAIEKYEKDSKGSFKTYAIKYIKGRILQYLRDKVNIVKTPRDANSEERNNTQNIISLDQNVYTADGQETLLDRIQSDQDEETFENKKLIEYALNHLNTEEKKAIYRYYIEGTTKREIAKELNISATQVARIIKRALNKMYAIIEKDFTEG